MKEALQAFALRFTPPASLVGGTFAIPALTGSADAFLAATLAGTGGEKKGEDKRQETRDTGEDKRRETRIGDEETRDEKTILKRKGKSEIK